MGAPLNTAYFTNLTAQISAAKTCAEIQALATVAVGSLNDLTASITAQAAIVVPELALLTPPTNPTAVITWVSNFITDYLTPQLASYTAYVAQLAALAIEAPAIIAAITAAAASIGSCSITIPTFSPGSVPSPPSPPVYPPYDPGLVVALSVVGAGTAASPLELVGDAAPSAGSAYYYGTDTSGTKGWYILSGGGGGGTVTSVGISTPGVGVVVGGGPITTAGTLTVNLSSTAYAALALAVTALQSISIATGTGLTGGPLAASGSTVALSAATIASLLPASPVQGDLAYYNGSAWALLAPGTAGYILQTNGAGANPTWVANGGGSTPVPATIPDLVCWFAFDNINSAAGKVQTGLFDRTPWRTGAAATLTTSTTAISSTQLNSLNTVTWTNGNAFPLSPSFSMAGGGTYFVVIKPAVNTGNQAIIGGSTGCLSLYLQTSGAANHIGLVEGSTAILTASTAAWVVGTWFQANVTYLASSGAFAYRQGRAAANSGTTTAFTVTPSTFFGSDGGTSTLNGASVAEFIAYNRVLSGTEITNVENYLNTKWGV